MITPALRYGVTRSGKPICTYATTKLDEVKLRVADFTIQDSFDAYALFEYLQQREIARSYVQIDLVNHFSAYSSMHRIFIGEDRRKALMTCLSLATIFDIVKYGKSCADGFFLD